jgi:DNA mismatch repair protein MutS
MPKARMTETQTGPKLTPMMEQYRSIKKSLSEDTILFFRLGDFYEMFFDDAVRGSEILNITLTGREGGEAGRIPMCGIPYHAFHGYVRTLVDHNLKVAVCEQVGDPKAGKGLVERRITRIISPATYLDDDAKTGNPEYMTALVREGGQCAMAYLDLGTGEFYVKEMDAERILSELTLLNPREIILSKTLADDSKLEGFIKESLNAGVTLYDDWIFDYEEAARLLKESFKLASEKSLSFHDRMPCVRAAGAILYYLRDHLHSALGHLRVPSLLAAGDFMVLDREAQKSLELVANLNGRKEGATLLACLDQTLTSMGTRALYHWVTHPLLSVDEIRRRQDAVEEFRRNTNELQNLRTLFKGVKDMERTLSRLNYGVANARDLVNLKEFLRRVPEIRALMAKARAEILKETSLALVEFPKIQDLVQRAIVEEPPLGLKDGGLIRDGYHTELDELRQISTKGKTWILEFEKREIERTGIRSLKVKYSNVFGYTIEISNANKTSVPADYTRKQTLANAERYIVPELREWDEKISGAQDKIKLLEYQLFNEVREQVLAELTGLQAMAKAVGVLDALASLAMIAVQKSWVRPEVTETDELVIRGGRHPVVEAMLAFGQFVENDTELDRTQNQLILLTGPNMAGKSTYIRQVAQIVLMAQIGSFVPATSAKIGLVDRIFTRIGAADNLAQGESTFMVEMLETAHILQSATSRSLLILDEVGRGTSTFDGVSIAWAICEHLAQGKNRPRTLFATHYHELTQLEDHFPGVKNYNILVRETKDGILFLRKVVKGGTDRSYGIHVARLAGIPAAVTKRAEEILGILESENTQATEIIEAKHKKIKKEKIPQPSLFDLAPKNHPLLDEIKRMAIENMTPLQALTKLVEIQERLKRDE